MNKISVDRDSLLRIVFVINTQCFWQFHFPRAGNDGLVVLHMPRNHLIKMNGHCDSNINFKETPHSFVMEKSICCLCE